MRDCIIIGSGPAGLSAALNLKKYRKDVVWFGSKSLSDKVMKAEKITNYPGFPKMSGTKFLERLQAHMENAGLEITEKTVTNVMHSGGRFMVLADNEIYEAKTIILAMGVVAARLMEGEERLLGKGVSYCATCDGTLYAGKRIAVVCNTPKFEHEVEYLADLASEVLYFPTFESRVERENVTISKDMPIKIHGEKRVASVTLQSKTTVEVDGVFCLRNAIVPTKLIPGIRVEDAHVVVDRQMATNLPGCFAAGDCTGRPYQYAKAVGEGNVAAHGVISYLASQS
jgi:thioredoxin reductase (NADPH)